MPSAARVSDMHVCPALSPGPHIGGPITMGAPNVKVGYMPASRVGDMATCVGPPDTICVGSMTVKINYMPAARMGDATIHGGSIVFGCPTVQFG